VKGGRKDIELEDLWDITDDDNSQTLLDRIEKIWLSKANM
jgi:hypothetical protein